MNTRKHDVIIIGGGPGGSTLAALLAKKGVDVAVIERETFPRFHIGESLLPATMPIFKETGFYEVLDSGKYIRKNGARFVDYRIDDEIYFGFEDGFNAEIPMAFEVPRAELDKDLLEHAGRCGAVVYQPERVKDVAFYDSHTVVKTSAAEYEARFVIDASGRDAMLGKSLKNRTVNKDLNNVAVFAHFTGVKRNPGKHEGDILIALLPERAWSWVIPFKGETTSVGVVCSSEVFKGGADLSEYLARSFAASSRLQEYMAGAERIGEITVISNYSHTCEKFTGERWMMIGDAAVFLDPIFSSGVHVSATSAKLASQVILKCLADGTTFGAGGAGERYQEDVLRGVKRFHNLISLFYNTNFVEGMKKTLPRDNMRRGFTSAVAGDMWNEDNFVLRMQVL